MKNFMAVFTGTREAMEKFQQEYKDEAKRKALEKKGIEAWEKWVKTHEKSIVEMGSPLGKTKRITAEGIADIRNNLAAYTVVEAESHEAAAKMFIGHPHFTIFPGDGVEVMECLPIPGR